MIEYTYTYLILGSTFLLIWLALFYSFKYVRYEMLFTSSIFAIAAPISDYYYFQDWWKPITLSGHFISIESAITGFAIGGIASVIYDVIFNKRIKEAKKIGVGGVVKSFLITLVPKVHVNKNESIVFGFYFQLTRSITLKLMSLNILNLLLATVIMGIVFIFVFYLFSKNTFIATIVSTSFITLIIWFKRNDLIKDSLISGLLLAVVALIVYFLVNLVTPNWIDRFWYFKNTNRILIGSLPLDDVIWYFLVGTWIGPFYEFVMGRKKS